ncbi:MAG: DNA polymerase, partial [Nitrosopumilus sp.]
KHKLKAQILLTVHDELLFQVHKSHLKKASKLLKEAMTIEIPEFVPLNVDMKIVNSWGTCSVE